MMRRGWRVFLSVLVVLTLGAGGGAGGALANFDPPGLSGDADRYASAIRAKAPPQVKPGQLDRARADADKALAAGDGVKAVAALEQVLALGGEDSETWANLARARMLPPKPNRELALAAAFTSYHTASGPEEEVDALWRLSQLFDETFDKPKLAYQAVQAIFQAAGDQDAAKILARLPGLEERKSALRQRIGLTSRSVNVNAETSLPEVCVQFSDALSAKKGVRFEDFVKLEPGARGEVRARGDSLCVDGLTHGASYALTLRQGLPGEDGLALRADEIQRFSVGDRAPSAAFRGSAFILPRTGGQGVPLTTVNLDTVAVKVLRVNDRSLAPRLREHDQFASMNEYTAESLAENEGEEVWQGRMTVANQRNREMVTALPFRQMVPEPKPGYYAIVAAAFDVPARGQPFVKATQWVLVTDIGLTALQGADGVTAFARSFSTAKPLAGVEVTLIARNNGELARVTSDADGRVRFPSGLAKGVGGNAPLAVFAQLAGDFAFLDLTKAAFDLSDRGVGGRATPGPLDAYVHTDRGVYRQGETVNLSVLLRDDKTEAVTDTPLVVKILRPSGTEYFSGSPPKGPDGAFILPLALSKTAPLGSWQIQAFVDPKAPPVGEAHFQVDDFVPERIAVEVQPSSPRIEPGQPFELLMKGRFLYGPPAAGLDGQAEMTLEPDPLPYPSAKGYRFGLIEEQVTQRQDTLEVAKTDANGETRIAVKLPPLPDTTRPLSARFKVALVEPGGRPARASLSVPVRTQAFAIGLRARQEGSHLAESQAAAFDVVALAPDGTPITKANLAWTLVEERTSYHWYLRDGRYRYRTDTRSVPKATGTLSVEAAQPAVLALAAQPLGRYRIEVADKATGVASSTRFDVGWMESADESDTPDTLELVADKPAYRAGEKARLKLTSPFAGEVLLTVVTDRLWESRTLFVAAEGGFVEVAVDAAWGPGAYVTATAYRPPVTGKDHQPVRAIGVAWLGLDTSARTLDVAIKAPEVTRPRGPVDVEIAVRPANGAPEDAWVTLAAVDEGILRLTDFASPDPGKRLFAKRQLGLDIRDDYGRLIDALDGPMGVLRQGGDSSGAALPVVPFTVVSLFQGPVKVGGDGIARVRLDIPDFNGQLRLMAVAWSKTRVGAAAARMIARDPLVADAITPRFLAPGDEARVTVSLHNVEAAAGTYHVTVSGADAVGVEGGEMDLALAAGERRSLILPLKGLKVGIGRVGLNVTGPGVALAHETRIAVRPARAVETGFAVRRLEPGQSARFGAGELAAYVPGTGRLAVTYGSGPPFDVAGVLGALDRYPFGCTEQTVSRALPLLVVRDVEVSLGKAAKPDGDQDNRVNAAIARVLDRQRYDGAFGVWGPGGEADPWLSAYAMEFLARARLKTYPVPDKPFQEGLTWLRHLAIDGGTTNEALASRAYALHVMALGGIRAAAPARYFADTFLGKLPTPLAKGQLGAALARLGDNERAKAAFAAATSNLARDRWDHDYGSTMRDAAALVTLIGEVGMLGAPELKALVDRLPASASAVKETNTQEKAWLVLAAQTLGPQTLGKGGSGALNLSVTGAPRPSGDPFNLLPTAAQLDAGLDIANGGKTAVWQGVSVSGVPLEPRPAAREGFRIKRNFLTRDGQPVNLDQIRQNDILVIVLEGEATTKLRHQIAISHPLPAGWEIEKARVKDGDLPWLKDLTTPDNAEGRDDRYTAAVTLTDAKPTFKLAYLVRAVTPGNYELPGAEMEDMYKPNFFARQAVGRIPVLPAQ